MEKEIIGVNTICITPNQNSARTVQREQFYEERLMRLEERIKEMEKTLTTSNPFPKGDLALKPIHEWSPNIPTVVTSETKMGQ